jgi:hypothetical protein
MVQSLVFPRYSHFEWAEREENVVLRRLQREQHYAGVGAQPTVRLLAHGEGKVVLPLEALALHLKP